MTWHLYGAKPLIQVYRLKVVLRYFGPLVVSYKKKSMYMQDQHVLSFLNIFGDIPELGWFWADAGRIDIETAQFWHITASLQDILDILAASIQNRPSSGTYGTFTGPCSFLAIFERLVYTCTCVHVFILETPLYLEFLLYEWQPFRYV